MLQSECGFMGIINFVLRKDSSEMKISSKEEFIENQYNILSKLQKLKRITPENHLCVEQEKLGEAAIISLLICHANLQKTDTFIIFRDILYLRTKLDKFPFLSDIIDELPEFIENTTSQITSENISIADEVANKYQAPMNTVEDKIDNNHVNTKIEDCLNSENDIDVPDNTSKLDIIAKNETTENDLIFGLYKKESENDNHHETTENKFLDTMWFNTFHITCNIKDGFMPEEFDLIVYPTEIRPDRRPVPQAVALVHQKACRALFSETQGNASLSINYEDFIFDVTSRFIDGELNTKISLASQNYEITDIDEQNYKGTFIPLHFGKMIDFGTENILIYPISLSNNVQSGCVPFMYKLNSSGNITMGISEDDDSVMIISEKGGVKHVTCYWKEQGTERRLIVIID